MLNQEELRDLFDYHEGNLYWKKSFTNSVRVGDKAGTRNKKGYESIMVHGKLYRKHRLVWNYFNNTCEGFHIDHKDRNPSNNCIENLRLATPQENARNSVGNKGALVSSKGVHKSGSGKFYAQIWIDTSNKYLGSFCTAEEASAAYNAAARVLHGDFYRKA